MNQEETEAVFSECREAARYNIDSKGGIKIPRCFQNMMPCIVGRDTDAPTGTDLTLMGWVTKTDENPVGICYVLHSDGKEDKYVNGVEIDEF